jgi:RNA polymerase sigma-70 factor (ECF subfamily)
MILYQAGEESAFDELYRRYSGRVYGYLNRKALSPEACDDIFQSVFLALHRSRDRYQAGVPFEAWLFTLARNAWADWGRKTGREQRMHMDFEQKASEVPDLEARLDLQNAFAAISPADQRAVGEKIGGAAIGGTPALRKRISRAVARLKKVFEGKN